MKRVISILLFAVMILVTVCVGFSESNNSLYSTDENCDIIFDELKVFAFDGSDGPDGAYIFYDSKADTYYAYMECWTLGYALALARYENDYTFYDQLIELFNMTVSNLLIQMQLRNISSNFVLGIAPNLSSANAFCYYAECNFSSLSSLKTYDVVSAIVNSRGTGNNDIIVVPKSYPQEMYRNFVQ